MNCRIVFLMGSVPHALWHRKLSQLRGDPAYIIEIFILNVGIHRLRNITCFYLANKEQYDLEESNIIWEGELIMCRHLKGSEDG